MASSRLRFALGRAYRLIFNLKIKIFAEKRKKKFEDQIEKSSFFISFFRISFSFSFPFSFWHF